MIFCSLFQVPKKNNNNNNSTRKMRFGSISIRMLWMCKRKPVSKYTEIRNQLYYGSMHWQISICLLFCKRGIQCSTKMFEAHANGMQKQSRTVSKINAEYIETKCINTSQIRTPISMSSISNKV